MKNYNEKQKQYILNNWKKYNCVDSKEEKNYINLLKSKLKQYTKKKKM